MNIADLIDQAKKAAGVESDSAFSKYLGLSRTAVGNWRSGVSLPDTVSCERLAGLTGQPLAKVIGMVGEARAHTREEKAVWRKLAATTALLAVIVFPALSERAQAATGWVEKPAQLGIMRNGLWGSWTGGQGSCVGS
jgi:transcriptional regulator with XRE-family HTH domain